MGQPKALSAPVVATLPAEGGTPLEITATGMSQVWISDARVPFKAVWAASSAAAITALAAETAIEFYDAGTGRVRRPRGLAIATYPNLYLESQSGAAVSQGVTYTPEKVVDA